MYSIITYFLASKVIDMVSEGMNESISVLIISDMEEELASEFFCGKIKKKVERKKVMSLETFQRKFRKKWKEKGLTLRIWHEKNKIKLSDGVRECFFHGYLSEDFYWLTITDASKKFWSTPISTDMFIAGVSYWKEVSKIENRNGVILKGYFREPLKVIDDDTFTLLNDKLTVHFDDFTFLSHLSTSSLSYFVVFENKNGEIERMTSMLYEFAKFFDDLGKMDPTMTVDFHTWEYSSDIKKFFDFRIGFYYKGLESNIELSYTDKKELLVRFDGKELIFTSPEQAKSFLEKTFKSIENKQRIKNIYNPPRKYLYRALSDSDIHKKYWDTIFNDLIQFYSPEEIENYFVIERSFRKINSYRLTYNIQFNVYRVFDRVYMVLNERFDTIDVYVSSIEEMEEKFTKIIADYVLNKVELFMNDTKNIMDNLKERNEKRLG